MFETKLISIGCDWLTGTTSAIERVEDVREIFMGMCSEVGMSLLDLKSARWQGYEGVRGEHCFFGARADGALVIVSGPLAHSYASIFIEAGIRPSRLDLECTWRIPANVGLTIESAFNQAEHYPTQNGKPPSLKMFTGRGGVEGLYVGRRTSETMLRCYDKYRESNAADYKQCIRFEAELKGQTARRYSGFLLANRFGLDKIEAVVASLYRHRGIDFGFFDDAPDVCLSKPTLQSTVEARMAWLATQVAPTVQALIERIGYARVHNALFPDHLVELDKIDVACYTVLDAVD